MDNTKLIRLAKKHKKMRNKDDPGPEISGVAMSDAVPHRILIKWDIVHSLLSNEERAERTLKIK